MRRCMRQSEMENTFEERACTKTLYNYIDQCLLNARNTDLPLRVKRKVSRQKSKTKQRLYEMSIEDRPVEAESRNSFGHGEIDTILGKRETSEALLCLDERYSRKRYLVKIASRSAEAVAEGIQKIKLRCGENFPKIFQTITSDNGSEFADLPSLLPETKIYYAYPYSSFERGTNEKQNSLVCRFFPKGTDFGTVSDEKIAFVEEWINNLPRRILNYHSSAEVFCSAHLILQFRGTT